jgi:hypothetical protein
MKLIRDGETGAERPGLVDDNGARLGPAVGKVGQMICGG